MKTLALLVTLTATTTTLARDVQKDVLTCTFTEPFITITYDAATGEITEDGPNQWDEEKEVQIPEVIATNGKFVSTNTDPYAYQTDFKLVDDKGNVILKATLDFKGSDSMSDRVYPFSAVHMNPSFGSELQGGCETKAAPAVDMNTIGESLKR